MALQVHRIYPLQHAGQLCHHLAMEMLIGIMAGILYLITGSGLGLRLFRGTLTGWRSRPVLLTLALVAIILHGVALHQHVLTSQGLDLRFWNALSLVSWLIAMLWWLASLAQPLENLGIAILPMAGLFLLLQVLLLGQHSQLKRALPGLDAHILLSILAYSVLSIAAVQAVLLAVQEKHLREKHPGGFIRTLPPLQTMEMLLFRMIGAGFILLSLALVSGALFVEDLFAQHLVHKTVLSIIAWVVFATLLWGRQRFGWRGRTAIRWTLSGFVSLMLAYFGTKWVVEVVLGR
jgi:ABC-type uncharacterized transport system permease subunit